MSSKSHPEHWSLATRLTAWYTGSAFAVVSLATGLLYWALVTNLDREDDQLLADKARILRVLLRDRPPDAEVLHQEVEWEWAASRYAQIYVRVLGSAGRTLLETPGMGAVLPAGAFSAPVSDAAEPPRGFEIRSGSNQVFRTVTASALLGPSGSQPCTLQLALDRTREEQLLAVYRRRLWLVLMLALVICATVGYSIAHRGMRPVQEIAMAARRVHSSTLNERIDDSGLPAELSALAATFNEMLDRLEDSFSRLSRFSADIAHELRTPVNNLRGEAEVALARTRSQEEYREVLGSCLEECARLSRLIDRLLFLARAESPEMRIEREQLDLARELALTRDYYEPVAVEAGVAIAVSGDGPVPAFLDRTLLQRALGNLVSNALAHTPRGGSVRLCAAARDGAVSLSISDTGSGIPAADLPHVFDRFYRVDSARSNSSSRVGLGLAIVKSIALLHGGSVHIDSEPGRGTIVSLVFPTKPDGFVISPSSRRQHLRGILGF